MTLARDEIPLRPRARQIFATLSRFGGAVSLETVAFALYHDRDESAIRALRVEICNLNHQLGRKAVRVRDGAVEWMTPAFGDAS